MNRLKGLLFVVVFGTLVFFNGLGYAEEASTNPMTQQEKDEQQKKEELKKEKIKKIERQIKVVDRVEKASAANRINGVSKNIPLITPTVRPASSNSASAGLAATKAANASRRY